MTPTERKVLYYIAEQARKVGTGKRVQLSGIQIARAVGTSRRRIAEVIVKLEKDKYILVERTNEEGGRGWVANTYTVLNPDLRRHMKVEQAADVAGIPVPDMVDYVHWLVYHQGKLANRISEPTIGDIAYYAHCPEEKAVQLVKGLVAAGILSDSRTVSF
jgi:hypothetical protein